MKKLIPVLSLVTLLSAGTAAAAELTCRGERIERGSSTWGYARSTGSDWRIEKGSSTVGWAKSANGGWRIETAGGSTLGWLKGRSIERAGGSTWARLGRAKRFAECRGPVAAALWILKRKGQL